MNFSIFPFKFPFVFTEAYGKPMPRSKRAMIGTADVKTNIGNKNIEGEI